MPTVEPLKTTARPACCMASTTVVSLLVRAQALLTPAYDEQQRVIDGDRQADQRDE
jgi:hypothetical protein